MPLSITIRADSIEILTNHHGGFTTFKAIKIFKLRFKYRVIVFIHRYKKLMINLEKRKMNTTAMEVENDKKRQIMSEKMEEMYSVNKNIHDKIKIAEKLSIEFTEKVLELKKACRELEEMLSK